MKVGEGVFGQIEENSFTSDSEMSKEEQKDRNVFTRLGTIREQLKIHKNMCIPSFKEIKGLRKNLIFGKRNSVINNIQYDIDLDEENSSIISLDKVEDSKSPEEILKYLERKRSNSMFASFQNLI